MIISGGSRGIGAATARLAADRGFAVALTYKTNQAAADAVVPRERGGWRLRRGRAGCGRRKQQTYQGPKGDSPHLLAPQTG